VDAIHGEYFDNRERPIITALICAGRIGSGIGAELGSMRVTEQIDAMEVSGTNPFKYLGHAHHGYHFNASYTCLFGDAIALSGSIWLNIKGQSYLFTVFQSGV
jgi:phospholipid/cholesterol/gamma-HCH transport system permease protein